MAAEASSAPRDAPCSHGVAVLAGFHNKLDMETFINVFLFISLFFSTEGRGYCGPLVWDLSTPMVRLCIHSLGTILEEFKIEP